VSATLVCDSTDLCLTAAGTEVCLEAGGGFPGGRGSSYCNGTLHPPQTGAARRCSRVGASQGRVAAPARHRGEVLPRVQGAPAALCHPQGHAQVPGIAHCAEPLRCTRRCTAEVWRGRRQWHAPLCRHQLRGGGEGAACSAARPVSAAQRVRFQRRTSPEQSLQQAVRNPECTDPGAPELGTSRSYGGACAACAAALHFSFPAPQRWRRRGARAAARGRAAGAGSTAVRPVVQPVAADVERASVRACA
jgi:hypothetical protein